MIKFLRFKGYALGFEALVKGLWVFGLEDSVVVGQFQSEEDDWNDGQGADQQEKPVLVLQQNIKTFDVRLRQHAEFERTLKVRLLILESFF